MSIWLLTMIFSIIRTCKHVTPEYWLPEILWNIILTKPNKVMFISNIYFGNWFGGFKSVSDYEWACRAGMQAVYPQKRGIRLLCRYFHYCKTLCNCNVKNKVIIILCNNTFQSFSFLLKRVQGKKSFKKNMLWRKYHTKK